ncbi:hypothetical protein ALP58_200042 [Pseudomonas savastanoi]|uniref:2-C-methyl-D-erythritol 4-phosphate cytidylyltransferase n=4 Tax=Pseudomonas TaxID=286 RepID=A0A0P9N9P7_PSESX|nr:DUF2778 domain-containing protein [Pseudomonas syringae]KPW94091.1 hypothetical protein ALO79_200221 [Pseudomonas syringae pv. castaneae]KPZ11090.1 hypothetical protein ALO40_200139 [Pseudomonas syringae pv. viburni]RMP17910.1 hypothetical protein ALQ27_200032 [Pseudomonas syringae pv. delphinii]RMS87718.1 hypothetical protein ALP58_200042 [Pseudomonas savastanoi]
MQICSMDYNDVSPDGRRLKLHVYGVGTFPVFSGIVPVTNIAECAFIRNAALPVGTYWIVDAPAGSLANQLERAIKDFKNGTNHAEWFGLYNSLTMSDHVFVNGVDRGSFRLHPLRPNGEGESWGCITFYNIPDFQLVRASLIGRNKVKVTGGNGLMAYGRIDVVGRTDYASCKVDK